MPKLITLREGLRFNKSNEKHIIDSMNSASNLFYAYHAGWADGDGCFSKITYKKTKYEPMYSLKIQTEEPLHHLADVVKSRIFLCRPETRPGHGNPHNPLKKIIITGEKKVTCLFNRVLPFLIVKNQKVRQMLIDHQVSNINDSYLNQNKEEFFAYMAGFLEAEGSFCYNDKASHYIITFTTTDLFFIDYIEKKFKEYGIKYGRYEKYKDGFYQNAFLNSNAVIHRKRSDSVYLSGKNSIPLLKEIVPHMLLPLKKEKALKLLNHKYGEKKNESN